MGFSTLTTDERIKLMQEQPAAPRPVAIRWGVPWTASLEPSAQELFDGGMPVELAREVDFMLRLPHEAVSEYVTEPHRAEKRLIDEVRLERGLPVKVAA